MIQRNVVVWTAVVSFQEFYWNRCLRCVRETVSRMGKGRGEAAQVSAGKGDAFLLRTFLFFDSFSRSYLRSFCLKRHSGRKLALQIKLGGLKIKLSTFREGQII